MPSITRRQFVAGGAAVTAIGYGTHRLNVGSSNAEFGSWTPEQGTWPLERYDTANTAHNPHANPPRETPETREVATVTSDGTDRAHLIPLAGPDRLVVFGDRLTAHTESGVVPYGESDARFAGFGPDDRLHAVRGSGPDTDLVGYEGGEEAYRYSHPDNAEGLILGREEAYVGTLNDGIVAYDFDGGQDWVAQGETAALADGHLYTVGGRDGPHAYRERTRPGRWVSAGPEHVWTAPNVGGNSHSPAVADGRLVVGTYGLRESALAAFDADTGEQLWDPRTFTDDGATDISTPAVDGQNGYIAAGIDGLGAGFVARYDLETGDDVWREDTDWYAYNPALAGNTVVVAGDVRDGIEAPATKVRAYDAETGDELWTVTFPGEGGTSLALVGERVLATAGSSLYELV